MSELLQLILHLWGDYIFQSDWAANNKTSSSFACFVHVALYSVGFYFISPSWAAFAVIAGTHFFIDRFRLAKYLAYAKNFLAPPSAFLYPNEPYDCDCGICGFCEGGKAPSRILVKYRWENCKANGYPSETPIWLSTWLMIITDNTLHLTINFLAIKFL